MAVRGYQIGLDNGGSQEIFKWRLSCNPAQSHAAHDFPC